MENPKSKPSPSPSMLHVVRVGAGPKAGPLLDEVSSLAAFEEAPCYQELLEEEDEVRAVR